MGRIKVNSDGSVEPESQMYIDADLDAGDEVATRSKLKVSGFENLPEGITTQEELVKYLSEKGNIDFELRFISDKATGQSVIDSVNYPGLKVRSVTIPNV